MGTFSASIEIGARCESLSALVNTGASYTVVPAALLRQLGVEAHERAPFIMADGSPILRDVGRTWIRGCKKSEGTLNIAGRRAFHTRHSPWHSRE